MLDERERKNHNKSKNKEEEGKKKQEEENMKYELEKKENGIYEATVKVDAKEWDGFLDTAYNKNKEKFGTKRKQ